MATRASARMSVASAASPRSIGSSTSESPLSTIDPTSEQSFASLRPPTAMRRLSGAFLARCRATSAPVNPVAPHTTTSNALDASGSSINDARGVGDDASEARSTNASRACEDDEASAMIRGMRRARGAARFGRLMPTRCEDIPARSARAEVDVAIVATRTDEGGAVDLECRKRQV